jgi:hypothetical protein
MGPAQARDSKFSFGLTYVSGFSDIVDLYKHNLEKEGYWVHSSDYTSMGISFRTNIKMFNKFAFGIGVGPLMYISAEEYDFFNIPASAFIRYTFSENANVSPYLCAGFSNHFASGDYVEDTTPGFMGGIGFELFKNRRVNMGILAIYDSSEIEFKKHQTYYYDGYNDTTEKIKPGEFMLGVYVIF